MRDWCIALVNVVALPNGTRNLSLIAERAARITGRVVDGHGMPVAFADVELVAFPRGWVAAATGTDLKGEFTLGRLASRLLSAARLRI